MKQPVVFVSHGGGPWNFIPQMQSEYPKTRQWLGQYFSNLPEKPKAILSITAHWEEQAFTVSAAAQPQMIYDYGGFPDYTYQVQYPAFGDPILAKQVLQLLERARLPSEIHPDRGFDHGTFVPLCLMFPKADVPVVSLSIHSSYDPLLHFQLGQAIQPLREQGVLIMGSGLSYHNMRGFGTDQGLKASIQFGQWLNDVVTEKNILDRKNKILNWESAPAARAAHPYEDHLVPLMSVIGAAGDDVGHIAYVDRVMNVDMASYFFT